MRAVNQDKLVVITLNAGEVFPPDDWSDQDGDVIEVLTCTEAELAQILSESDQTAAIVLSDNHTDQIVSRLLNKVTTALSTKAGKRALKVLRSEDAEFDCAIRHPNGKFELGHLPRELYTPRDLGSHRTCDGAGPDYGEGFSVENN